MVGAAVIALAYGVAAERKPIERKFLEHGARPLPAEG